MDRFIETPLTSARPDRDEDGILDPPYVEPLHCQSCDAIVTELLLCIWDPELLVGKCCVELPEEECACQFFGDTADASDCPVHGLSIPRLPVMRVQYEPDQISIEDLLDYMPDSPWGIEEVA